MSDDQSRMALILAVLLILPVSALLARRVPIARVLWMLLSWGAIFGVGLYVLAPIVKEEMRDFAAKLRSGEITEVSVEEAKQNRR